MKSSTNNLCSVFMFSLLFLGLVMAGCEGEPAGDNLDVVDTDTTVTADTGDYPRCEYDQLWCDGECVEPLTDPDHCGVCGNSCAGYGAGGEGDGQAGDGGRVDRPWTCVGGRCVGPCPGGQTLCGGGDGAGDGADGGAGICYDLTTSRTHCGECGNRCGDGAVCVEGECVTYCLPGQSLCDGACVDLQSSRHHCGECDDQCDEGVVCSDGECSATCATGFSVCGEDCVDHRINHLHCGRCDVACPKGQYCFGGECRMWCPEQLHLCDGICVDVLEDPANCGKCGEPCLGSAICVGGECFTKVTGLALNRKDLTLQAGTSGRVVATVTPPNATNPVVVWTTLDPEVATVDEGGTVRGAGPGETFVVASTADGGYQVSCIVRVYRTLSGLVLEPSSLDLSVGNLIQLQVTKQPADATLDPHDLVWSSSHGNIAAVDDGGGVFGISPGQATITVETRDGARRAQAQVAVSRVPATGVLVNPPIVGLRQRQTAQLTAIVQPPDASNKRVTWVSNAPHIVTVTNTGMVEAVGDGVAVVAVIAHDGGYQARSTVSVNVPVVDVRVEPTSVQLERHRTVTLEATVLPLGASNQMVQWSSSDRNVATVNTDGVVTGVAPGVATITATTIEGSYTARCTVTVWETPVTKFMVDSETLVVLKGEQAPIVVTIEPEDASDQRVLFRTTNPGIATVDEQGVVTGVDYGQAVITVESVYSSSFSHQIQVTVPIPVTGMYLSDNELVMAPGDTHTLEATVLPPDATFKEVIWESSHPDQVRVDENGVVTVLQGSKDEVIISATTIDGNYYYECVIKVNYYLFDTHTFSNCSKTGQTGPTLAQCKSSYSTVTWAEDPDLFTVTNGIQNWTVPGTGTYRIEVWGAQGGQGNGASRAGGLGARMRGDFELEIGEHLHILVGQQGSGGTYGAGGGGGSFVVKEKGNEPMIIAGGGGGGGRSYNDTGRSHGTTAANGRYGLRSSNSNGGSGGTGGGNSDNGNRYNTSYGTGGGGGFNTNGVNGTYGGRGGASFKNGGNGGARYSNSNAGHGGFGGGAGGTSYSSTTYYGGGGGGGYAGGGGGYTQGNGGGAGSYNGGTNPSNSTGNNTGHGKVTITLL